MTETSSAYSNADDYYRRHYRDNRYRSRSRSRDNRQHHRSNISRHSVDRQVAALNASAAAADRVAFTVLAVILILFVFLPPIAIITLNSAGVISVNDIIPNKIQRAQVMPIHYDVLLHLGYLYHHAIVNETETRHVNGTSSITFSVSEITKKIRLLTGGALRITTARIDYGVFNKKRQFATVIRHVDLDSTVIHFAQPLHPDIIYKITMTFKSLAYEEAGNGLIMYRYLGPKFKPGYLAIKGLTHISEVMPVFDLDKTLSTFFVRFINQQPLQVNINPGGMATIFPVVQRCHAKDVVLFHDPNTASLYQQRLLDTSLYAVFGSPKAYSKEELVAVFDKLKEIVPSGFHPGIPYVILRSDLIINATVLFKTGFYASDNMIVTTTHSKVSLPFSTTRVLFGSVLSPRITEDIAFVEAVADYYYFSAVAPLSEHTVTSYLGYYKDQILEGAVVNQKPLKDIYYMYHGAVDWITWKSAFIINGLAEIVGPGQFDNAIRRITRQRIPNDFGMPDLANQLQPTANVLGAKKINCSDGSGALNVYDYLHAYLFNPTFPIIQVKRVGKDLHIMQEPAVKTEISYPPWTIPLRHHGKLLLLCSKKMVLQNVQPPDDVEIPQYAFAANHTFGVQQTP